MPSLHLVLYVYFNYVILTPLAFRGRGVWERGCRKWRKAKRMSTVGSKVMSKVTSPRSYKSIDPSDLTVVLGNSWKRRT